MKRLWVWALIAIFCLFMPSAVWGVAISELPALTTVATGDMIAIVDVSPTPDATSRITWGELMAAPGAIGGTTPGTGAFTSLKGTIYGSDGSITDAEFLYINTLSSNAQTQLDARCLESVFGTAIGAGLTLDGTTLKTHAALQSIAGLTETNGGIPYGTADNAYAWLGAGAQGTLLMGNGAGAPSFLGAGAASAVLLGAGAADPVWSNEATFKTALNLEAGTDYYSKTAEDTWRNGATQTEMGYVAGTTSDIQTQFSGKAATTRKLDDFGTPDDNTDLNATTTYHGLLPKLNNSAVNFLNGQGSWVTPAGGGNVSTSGTPVANDIARFTSGTDIEGRSYAEFKADLDLEIGTDILAQQTIGIADDNLLEVDQADAASGEYGRFTANGLESRSIAEVKSDLKVMVEETVADEAEITLATGVSGWGFAQAGDNEEWIQFCFTAAGVVTVISNSANAVNTDTDGNLCVYDAGSGIAIKNRLGASKTIRYSVNYS